MTALDLIMSSMRLIGVLASGETPNGNEQADALAVLNDLFDSWSADKLTVFTNARQVLTLAAGSATRTMGSGGNLNVARPPKIERAGIIYGGLEYPIEYTTEIARWAEVTQKTLSTNLPCLIWDDCGFPLRTLSFYPIPSGTIQVVLYTWTALSAATLTTTIALPPGYSKALRYNLAVDLAAEWGKPLSVEVATQAVLSKAVIAAMNLQPLSLSCDPAVLGSGSDIGMVNSAAFNGGW